MPHVRSWALLPFLVLALVAMAAPAAAQETTLTLEGLVVNGTADGDPVEGMQVTIQAFREGEEVDRREGTVGPGGKVAFDGLDASNGLLYVLSAAPGDVRYYTPPISTEAPPEGPVELRIFETTEDPTSIRILADSTIILGPDGESGGMRVMQVTTYENVGDRAFIGTMTPGGRVTIEVAVPPQALNVTAAHDAASLVTMESGAVFSTFPMLPGTEDLIVTYRIVYTGQSYQWAKTFPYPIERARLLVPEGLTVEAVPELRSQGPSVINGVTYTMYEAQAGSAGGRLTARISGLTASAGSRSGDLGRILRYAAIGIVVVGLVGAGGYAAYWGLRRRGDASVSAGPVVPTDPREEALDRLAVLDEEFEAGRLSQEDYNRRRETERANLRRLLEEGGR